MMNKKLSLYQVDLKYNRDLAKYDENVLSVSPQIGKSGRPFIGVLVMVNGKEYCAPISSPKPKHETMPKNFDYLKITERINGKEKLIAVINFNNMIPVHKSVIKKMEVKIFKNDPPNIKTHKRFLAKELDWCQKNADVIQKNAQKTYRMITEGKAKPGLIRRCCDFKKLEAVLEKRLAALAKTTD